MDQDIIERIVNELGAGMLYLDSKGRVLSASKSLADAGITEANARGKYIHQVIDSEDLKGIRVNQVVRKRIRLTVNGQIEAWRMSFLPVLDPGSGARWVVVCQRNAGVDDRPLVQPDGVEPIMIGTGAEFARLKTLMWKAAQTTSTVLLTGETGTGKSLAAEWIHYHSGRGSGPFVAVNCSALPATLIESELFGYEEGAFTGARRGGKPGKFELAGGGTILLDEIGDLPLELQGKLLQVLDSGRVDRVGGRIPKKVDTRVIAATNRDLNDLVDKGEFRADLYFRLSVLNIHIPPLRERLEDIPALVQYFMTTLRPKVQRRIAGISPECIDVMMTYHWPGNIRELANVIEYSMLVCELDQIEPAHLPPRILTQPARLEVAVPTAEDCAHATAVRSLAALEDEEISKCVKLYGLSEAGKRKMAETLGISRSTLYRKLRRLGYLGYRGSRPGAPGR